MDNKHCYSIFMKPSASTEISRHAQWREQILSGARHTAICSRGQLQVPSGMTNTPPGCGRAWRGAWGEREGASAARCPPPTAHRPSPVARGESLASHTHHHNLSLGILHSCKQLDRWTLSFLGAKSAFKSHPAVAFLLNRL